MKGWRTVAFNVIMTLVMIGSVSGIFNSEAPAPTEEQIIKAFDAAEAAITAIWGLGNIILRAVTTTGIFKRN